MGAPPHSITPVPQRITMTSVSQTALFSLAPGRIDIP
jgi:hypothetical protein